MIDPHSYSISVQRGEFDGENCFEARIKEFPDIIEYADSFEEAYELAIDSIETTIEIFIEKGRHLPDPYTPTDDYSGRVTLRTSKSLHRTLAILSELEGVSLNQHLCNVLSYYSGVVNIPKTKSPSGFWSPMAKTIQKSKAKPCLTVVKRESTPLRKEMTWPETA